MLIGGLLIISYLAAFIFFKTTENDRLFRILLAEFILLICFGSYYCFDYYYWSTKYHFIDQAEWKRAEGLDVTFPEKIRKDLFYRLPFFTSLPKSPTSLATRLITFLSFTPNNKRDFILLIGKGEFEILDDTKEAVQAFLSNHSLTARKRILFLGSSQMAGRGAALVQDSIAVQAYEALRNAGMGDEVVIINGSKEGTTSNDLLERCKDRLFLFQPEIVMINLSVNDLPKTFRKGLEGLSAWASTIHARVIFIQEANSLEVPKRFLSRKHSIMTEVARSTNAPMFPLHAHMSGGSIYDSGMIWWDPVHMTSYGQQKAGEFIAEQLIKTGFLKDQPAGYNQ